MDHSSSNVAVDRKAGGPMAARTRVVTGNVRKALTLPVGVQQRPAALYEVQQTASQINQPS
jgi:hypothetical protein